MTLTDFDDDFTSVPVPGHALDSWETRTVWSRQFGTHRYDQRAVCECGDETGDGVNNLGAARQWHREHKAQVVAAGASRRAPATAGAETP